MTTSDARRRALTSPSPGTSGFPLPREDARGWTTLWRKRVIKGHRKVTVRSVPAGRQIHDAGLARPPDVERALEVDRPSAARRVVGPHLLLGDVQADLEPAVKRGLAAHRAHEVGDDV